MCTYKRGIPAHCKQGHELRGNNLMVRGSGQRSCRQCEKDYYAANRVRILAGQKKDYYGRNREKILAARPRRHLWVKYKMTLEDKQKMFVEQKGLCHICGRPMDSWETSVVDHNHYTNQIRGLAHDSCNTRMGTIECLNHNDPETLMRMFKIVGIEPKLLREAAEYLENFNELILYAPKFS